MSGPLRAAWALTAFVVVVGLVLWLVTGHAVFAVFIGLGVLTAIGAVLTGRAEKRDAADRAAPRTTAANREETP